MYNPIFEEECSKCSRDRELKYLRDSICLRATQTQFKDLAFKFTKFVKAHPVVTLAAAGVLGFGFSAHR